MRNGTMKARKFVHLSSEEIQEARSLYSSGMGMSKVAEWIGCTPAALFHHMDGIPRHRHAWTEEEKRMVTGPFGRGTAKEIALSLGITKNAVYRKRQQLLSKST